LPDETCRFITGNVFFCPDRGRDGCAGAVMPGGTVASWWGWEKRREPEKLCASAQAYSFSLIHLVHYRGINDTVLSIEFLRENVYARISA
jgi:hypothetical protein